MEIEELLELERSLKAASNEIAKQEAALAEQRAAIYAQTQDIRERKYQLRLETAERQHQLEAEQREAARQEAEQALQGRLAANGERLDALTKDAPWRNRAMTHQIEGAKFLATAGRAICADGMGVGKTLGSLIFLDMVDSKLALIICQGDVISNFVDELKRFTDRPVMMIGKMPKATQLTLISAAPYVKRGVYIINYESWFKNRAILDELIKVRFDTVIVDEAHIIKETDKAPYKGVEKIVLAANSCPVCSSELKLKNDYYHCTGSMAECDWYSGRWPLEPMSKWRSVKYFLPMTGTPILNRPDELYASLHLINDEIFKQKNHFIQDFCQYDYYTDKLTWRPGGQDRLAKKIAAFYLRRTHDSAGITLPPQGITTHEIDFDPELYPLQAKCLAMLKKHAQLELESGRAITIQAKLALITRLRQAATWPGGIRLSEQARDPETGQSLWSQTETYADGSAKPLLVWFPVGDQYRESQKMDKAVELIRQFNDDGQRVAVFSQLSTALEELQERLGDKSARFDGSVADDKREEIKRNFNREFGEEPKWDNILCNYKTGGTGLNLTSCTALVVLDFEWNQSKADQAYARINRIGQTENTQVHILKLMGTMDQWMEKLITEKAKVTGDFEKAMNESDSIKNDFAKELDKLIRGEN